MNIFDPEIVYIGGIVEGFFETIRPIIAEELEGRMVREGFEAYIHCQRRGLTER